MASYPVEYNLRNLINVLIGSPYTLGQAQNHISRGPLGERITWVQQSPVEYLASLPPNDKIFDATILAHSLW